MDETNISMKESNVLTGTLLQLFWSVKIFARNWEFKLHLAFWQLIPCIYINIYLVEYIYAVLQIYLNEAVPTYKP
jgi:hypothetical protein